MKNELLISEVFGPTVQGEGPNFGRRCGFIRLHGCNLTCQACDTSYSWTRSSGSSRPVADILTQVTEMGKPTQVRLVVITGGEPLVQQHRAGFRHLILGLIDLGADVQFETNGTLEPSSWLRHAGSGITFVVSPKISGPLATNSLSRRINPMAISGFSGQPGVSFKFVVSDEDDVRAVGNFVKEYGIDPKTVWIMPEGTTAGTVVATSRRVADITLAHGFNVTSRLHTILWPGAQRGK